MPGGIDSVSWDAMCRLMELWWNEEGPRARQKWRHCRGMRTFADTTSYRRTSPIDIGG